MVFARDLESLTFPSVFKNSLVKYRESNALSFVSTKPLTYGEIGKLVTQVSKILSVLGIKKGDKVALYSTSTPHWGAAYFAIVNMGAVAVPLLPDFTAKEVETMATHAEVSGIIVGDTLLKRFEEITPAVFPFAIRISDFKVIRTNGQSAYEKSVIDINTKDLPPCEDCRVEEDDTASIIYTSGTTGRSKGVELSHKNLVWCAIQAQTMQRINKLDRCLSFLPLSHVYEFSLGFVLQFLNGSCIYYLERPPTVSTLLPALKKIRPTIVLSVPIIMEKIYKNKIIPTFTKTERIKKIYNIRFFQKILHRIAGKSLKKTFGGKVKFFGIGGAKVDPVVEQFLKDAKFPYAIGYGLTETSPLVAGTGPKHTVPGTIGPALRGVDMKTINCDPKTRVGEVVIKGENVMKGYYKEPAMTADVFTTQDDDCGEGYFKTGDLGLLHNGMWLELKGRLKNMILGSSGENIYPEDIEFVLNQHPDVLESLVIEDDKGLVALVQLNEDKKKTLIQQAVDVAGRLGQDVAYSSTALMGEIKYFVNEQVNRFSKLTHVHPVEDFEKTASQKIKRYLYNLRKGTTKTDNLKDSEDTNNDNK
ncbi:MAG TPA: AMP-binding protein [Treponemataceae bacterium]|nr:AMP-binding protein [Treponemataceae bacterium]